MRALQQKRDAMELHMAALLQQPRDVAVDPQPTTSEHNRQWVTAEPSARPEGLRPLALLRNPAFHIDRDAPPPAT